jgi:hypothetical protein
LEAAVKTEKICYSTRTGKLNRGPTARFISRQTGAVAKEPFVSPAPVIQFHARPQTFRERQSILLGQSFEGAGIPDGLDGEVIAIQGDGEFQNLIGEAFRALQQDRAPVFLSFQDVAIPSL